MIKFKKREDRIEYKCTVNKLGSVNLHLSRMFCIERKVVHVGEEKIITFNDAEDYDRGEI
jgi:hypothetical protein